MARTQKHVSSLAVGGGTGGTGDPWTLPESLTYATAGMDINIWKDGIYVISGVMTFPNVGTQAQPTRWRGRSGSSGTNGDALQGYLPTGFLDTSNMPTLGDGSTFGRIDSGQYNIFEGILFNLKKADGLPTVYVNENSLIRCCDITCDTTSAYGAVGGRGSVYDCDINQLNSGAFGVDIDRKCLIARCRIKSAGDGAKFVSVYGGASIANSVFYEIAGNGIHVKATNAGDQLLMTGTTLIGKVGSGDGILIAATSVGEVRGCGNIIRGFDGYGVNIAGVGGNVLLNDTRFYDNALGDWFSASSDAALLSLREVTAAHDDFVAAAGKDWRLLRSSPARDATLRGMSAGACDPRITGILGYGCA